MGKRVPLFYGWVIVGVCVVSMVLIYGIRHSFSVFFSPILEEFSWSRGNINYGIMGRLFHDQVLGLGIFFLEI